MSLIRREAGFDLSGYRPSPLLWRIQQRMDVRRVRSFEDYAWLIEDEPVELEALVRGLPIHVTEFFRDGVAWTAFKNEVLEPLVYESNGTPLRIWTPACATGEEAYSMAILLDEIVHESGRSLDYQIFATDAAPEAVVRASRGCYRAETCSTMDPTRLSRYFYTADGRCRIKRFLRERMVFAVQDVISDPPISSVNVVTCRNLLIYLEPETIKKVLHTLNSALCMGGSLFLGASEAYAADKFGFAAVSRKWNIHRKVARLGALNRNPAPSRGTVLASSVRAAAERNRVPTVLIDEECNLLRLYGDTTGILNLPAGEPTLNLLRLVDRTWVGQLKAAVRQALGSAEACAFDRSVARDGQISHVTVSVTPLEPATDGDLNRVLVSFNTLDDTAESPSLANLSDAGVYEDQRPWTEWEDDLRISREELDASREELHALNEELKAANADLNASNQELNEANFDLKEKIAEIKMQSDVLSSGAVMTLFLDRDQKIRWFTPSISQAIPIQREDVGRCVSDLSPSFHDPLFASDIHAVLATGAQSDAVVSRSEDRWLLRRIYPHRSSEGVMLGVAITFADVTDRTRAEHGLQRSKIWLSAQKEAFQSAMNGDSLQTSLGFLLQSLLDQAKDDRRCAFYIAQGKTLHHVVGMPEEYAKYVDGFVISPESLACGLAVATGVPVITPDVLKEPRWQPWTWLALQFNYRGCWSFPVETSAGNLVGSLAMYFERPREPTGLDIELATAFTHTAGIIISQHNRAEPAAAI
ncbi:CheR family methyltransferase [Cupriavidus sp. WKF15]|uniref:CheR family methyltransferase n=1 Tax=Cupriavidus sp. WKF15 TaxID=3032282 RepID=UPI0023E30866|nr:CheR family methyltransferase [Cupriavidus sp. WKF15]WER48990.1 CheR family methyltransferase [Cupriavidus sp. WKF15]